MLNDVLAHGAVDFARAAAAGLGLVVLAASGRVAYLRTRPGTEFRGLPLTVLAAYALLVFGATVDQFTRLGEPVTWRLPVYLVALLLGTVAGGQVLHIPGVSWVVNRPRSQQRHRVRRGRRRG